MGSSFSLILLGILGVFGVVFYFYNKKNSGGASSNSSGSDKSSKGDSAKNQEVKKEDIFKFMEFDKIQDDMIVQNKGQKYTMAIKCKGINYDLMSDVEQMSVEEGFITFLNTLKYPIQLYVQAQNIDLKGAINTYKENIASIREEFENADSEYTKVSEAFESTQDEIEEVAKKRDEVLNVYEYANDIISYVERMSMNKSLLQRSFYVLVSYHTSEINSTEKFSKQEIDDLCYSELFTRAQAIISALAACSVEGKVLNSNELADLLYTAYNRDDRGLMNIKEAIDSGFYRLYSTSKDVFAKRAEKLKHEIEDNARIKAYQAIVDTINDGSYESPMMSALKVEEDTSRLANEIIKRENVPAEVKEAAQKKVVDDYRETKKQVMQAVNDEKKVLFEKASKELGLKEEPKKIEEINKIVEPVKPVQNEEKNTETAKIENTTVVNNVDNNNTIPNSTVNTTENNNENVVPNVILNVVSNEVKKEEIKPDVTSSENDSIV